MTDVIWLNGKLCPRSVITACNQGYRANRHRGAGLGYDIPTMTMFISRIALVITGTGAVLSQREFVPSSGSFSAFVWTSVAGI